MKKSREPSTGGASMPHGQLLQPPQANWHFFVWPILGLWILAAIYVLSSDWRESAHIVLPIFMATAVFLVLLGNAIAGTIAQRRYELNRFDNFTNRCMGCNRRDGTLHVIDYHWYLFLIITVVQFGEPQKLCPACAKTSVNGMFWRTVLGSLFCPPIIVWAWVQRYWIMRRIPPAPWEIRPLIQETEPTLAPIDEMLAIMLPSWNHQYSFDLNRITRKAVFQRGELIIHAEEKPDGLILVSLVESGRLYTKLGNPEDSAAAIHAVILPVATESDYQVNRQATNGTEALTEQKHSALGIASFVICLVVAFLFAGLIIAMGITEASRPGGMDENSTSAMALLGLNLVAFGLGVSGLFQKDRKKLFAIVGTVFSLLMALGGIGLVVWLNDLFS